MMRGDQRKSIPFKFDFRCSVSWEGMEGDDRSRFCKVCNKHVYVLNALSTEELTNLKQETGGKFCARIEPASDKPMHSAKTRAWDRYFAGLILLFMPLITSACRKKVAETLPTKSSRDTSNAVDDVPLGHSEFDGYEAALPGEPLGGSYTINSTGTDPVCDTGYPGHGFGEIGIAITELEG